MAIRTVHMYRVAVMDERLTGWFIISDNDDRISVLDGPFRSKEQAQYMNENPRNITDRELSDYA